MTFVTVGTQKQDFKRLFEWLENIEINDKVVLQQGYTNFQSEKYESYEFPKNYQELLSEANVVICHGGVGSIIEAISKGKKVIAIPRLQKYGEHVDDHQIEIVNKMEKQNYIFSANSENELQKKLETIKVHEFKKYKSNNEYFNDKLNDLIVRMEDDE